MPWSELIDTYEEEQPHMRLSYGNKRFDVRAIDVIRKMGEELDINVGDSEIILPSLFHNIIELDVRRIESVLEPVDRRNDVFNTLDRVGGKKIPMAMDNRDYYALKSSLSGYTKIMKRWLNDPINFIQAILVDVYWEDGK